tara:strand:+ start:3465 stop:3902 length:438 start_codon:yes stop_codon:yes gene_type:complete
MEEADILEVAAIEDVSALPQRSLEARKKDLSSERNRGVVLESGGLVVGLGSLWLAPDEAHVTSLAVSKEMRRRGHGRRLVWALVALAEFSGSAAITLECRASNGPAQKLYRGLGFEGVGERRHYYIDGEDATILTRKLGGAGVGG